MSDLMNKVLKYVDLGSGGGGIMFTFRGGVFGGKELRGNTGLS